ncbi:nuclear transport factor 2 family protein [Curtobacterium sp. USHLN213]|uniref:nuclear transport factor 2 family protein n=1 Tax=Curtobacterium sp. USHLN213 TaxID=3081255 RepID=UPI003019B9AC
MDDVTDISQLVLRERQGRDRGLWDRMRDAWEPDGRVRISWFDGSARDFVAGSIAMAAGGTAATHRMSPPVVDLLGDRAIVAAPAVIEVRAGLGGAEVDLASRVRLLYRARRTGTGWRLAAMTCVYESDTVTPTVPGTVPDLSSVAVDDRRPSYRWLATVLGASGHRIADDLPGTDRPGSVEAVEAAEQDWLDGHDRGVRDGDRA